MRLDNLRRCLLIRLLVRHLICPVERRARTETPYLSRRSKSFSASFRTDQRKVVSAKRVTLPAKPSTLASVYIRKKVTSLLKSRGSRSYSDRFALTESKVSIWRKVGAARRVTLYRRKKVTRPTPLATCQPFVSHVNGSSSFVRKCRKS